MLRLLLAVTLATHTASAQQDTSWSSLYRRDLDSLRATIAADHPGALDRENPAFAQTLTTAYRDALAPARRLPHTTPTATTSPASSTRSRTST